ncbi:hypothetical protein GCM10028818_00830 [Spirosoma horti]
MEDLFYRTEDIKLDEILKYFVETSTDRTIVNSLKSRNPVIVVGSRGVGKSFLLRTAEAEMMKVFDEQRVFPVYITFIKSSLIYSSNDNAFQSWMLAKITSKIIRDLQKAGLIHNVSSNFSILAGSTENISTYKTKLEELTENFENSYKKPGEAIDTRLVPTVEVFKEAIEDICHLANINRIVLFIDEAAHIFIPSQQRQFFTLFRDLRSPYLTCNAAVYPGVTSYGETFQPVHDATMLAIDRDVTSDNYIANMKEIVQKQAGSSLMSSITKRGQLFATLAYAANGNPRILLKTLNLAPDLSNNAINELIREYYRTTVWAEHSLLSEKYEGHRALIDWGRRFIEQTVLPELYRKNLQYQEDDKKTTCFFWIHRDAPQIVKEAIRILAYTGIVTEHGLGIKATRSEIGTRYMVNLGCLFALDPNPAQNAFNVAKQLTIKRMSEYGANHLIFQQLAASIKTFNGSGMIDVLNKQLTKPINVLDIPKWQKNAIESVGVKTIEQILNASEQKLKEAFYIGDVRSRRIKNAAVSAVYEYISG